MQERDRKSQPGVCRLALAPALHQEISWSAKDPKASRRT
jgi:hypothetical protein